MEDGSEIEIGTIGREGTSAFPLLMGASSTANVCYCQVRGAEIKLPAAVFRELTATDTTLRQRLDRYLQAYVIMLGQLAAIVNRVGLEDAVCECYAVARKQFDGLLRATSPDVDRD
jgi:hypothetical protein